MPRKIESGVVCLGKGNQIGAMCAMRGASGGQGSRAGSATNEIKNHKTTVACKCSKMNGDRLAAKQCRLCVCVHMNIIIGRSW
jgi:hypothetical protein